MKKFAGVTREQVDAELKWIIRFSNGNRIAGTKDKVDKIVENYEEDEWDYIKDIDVAYEGCQTPAMAKFVEEWDKVIAQYGFVTINELFERYGIE